MLEELSMFHLGLSKKKRLPTLLYDGYAVYPHQMLRFLWDSRKFLRKGYYDKERGELHFHIGSLNMVLPASRYYLFIGEHRDWERNYLHFDVKGKTVLDVGAGAGETAMFFYLNGARRVDCVEIDPKLGRYLKINKQLNDWDINIWIMGFKELLREIPCLFDNYDVVKIDIEGDESVLLENMYNLPDTIIEYHSDKLRTDLERTYCSTTKEKWLNLGYAFIKSNKKKEA
nr:hypothetical protein [Candidatus Freyarchaeota archaeon]